MRIRTRRLAVNLPVAVLLSAPLITAAVGNGAQASSSPRSLPTWAHGSITGAGPHNGVRLVLVAWPSQSAMAKIRVGQKVHLRVVGKTTSSTSGRYAIHASVALSKGIHNLEVLARSSVAVGAFGFARKVTQRGAALLAVDGSAITGPVTANIHMMALPKWERSPVRHPSIGCIPIAVKTRELGQKYVTVAGLYSTLFPASMKMTYTAGSNTTLGLGISVSGEYGSFTTAGTFTETAGSKVLFPHESNETGRRMQTKYTFGVYNVCSIVHVTPEKFAGGDNEPHGWIPGTVASNCTHYNNGGGLNRTSGTAGTFSAGVDLKKVIGISLSAQSGYTKQVSILYTFPAGGWLCGSNDVPPSAKWDVMDPIAGNVTQPGVKPTGTSG